MRFYIPQGPYLPASSVLLLGISFTFILVWTDYLADRDAKDQMMQRHVMIYSNATERAFERSQAVVENLVALFYSSSTVSRGEFDTFSRNLFKYHSSMQALEWIPKVPFKLREHYEILAQQYYPEFQFTDKDEQGNLIRAGHQDYYYPVFYLAPYAGNERALGYSPSKLDVRDIAMEKALSTGQTYSSSRVQLVQDEQPDQYSLLLFSPVFKTQYPPATLSQRAAELRGYILGIVRISDLIDNALGNHESYPMSMALSDMDAAEGNSFLYLYQGKQISVAGSQEADSQDGRPPRFYSQLPARLQGSDQIITRTLNQLGHRWTLAFYPKEGAYEVNLKHSFLIFSLGTLLSLVIAYGTWLWSRRQMQLQSQLTMTVEEQGLALKVKDKALLRHNRALMGLTSNPKLLQQKLDDSLSDITRIAAETLGVERASVWLLSDNKQSIRCFDLYELAAERHSSGVEMHREDYPQYFEAILKNSSIVVNDAFQDPRTREFGDSYLKIIDIKSMLDVPIRRNGDVVGVLCMEHVHTKRCWLVDEEHFCHSVANFVSLAMESIERRQTEQQLQESSERLAIINGIATNVSAGMSVKQVIGATLDRLHLRFPQLRVSYSTISEGGLLSVEDSRSPSHMPDISGVKADLQRANHYLKSLLKRQMVLVTDVRQDPRLSSLKEVLAAGNTRALLDMPLLHSQELVGMLCLDSSTTHFWNENEILTLQEIAEYLEFAVREAMGQEAREKAEHALEQHKANLEQLVHKRTQQLEYQAEFERLIANLSTQFIRLPADQLEAAIIDALQVIGEFSQVDRCSLARWNNDDQSLVKDFEWLSEGIDSIFPEDKRINISQMTWLVKRLLRKKPLYFSDFTQMTVDTKDAQRFFEGREIRSLCMIPLLYGMSLFGVLVFSTQSKKRTWSNNDLILLNLIGEMLVNAFERKKYEEALKNSERLLLLSNKKLEDLVTVDSLTGIANRRFFDLRYRSEFHRAQRYGSSLGIIFLDIDYFKQYNDDFGHLAGDKCLTRIAKILSQQFQRATEVITRYGGEEFVAILSNVNFDEAVSSAERARLAVEELGIKQGPSCPLDTVTLSCGVSLMTPDVSNSKEELIKNADSALYQAKKSGRNCVKTAVE
ncbi:diguanylate cyclase [Motiliproteus sp. MSK22-1]|uniref:diguanylate cyclase n=1 Tax=Motiliproteus sp. MSK22-1 TaxID=1897630 RepID=UPI000975C075|nr:diguanylate cyclase [Motiliproteus sp. MSK22-1]OMH31724.1 hypothetical protein BGP75_16510 [Motiliproteus sp. MSK22-1]